MDCVFCKIAKGESRTNIIYKDEVITCFLDCDPINEGHVLIIPNDHYLDADELPDDILYAIAKISKKMVAVLKKKYQPNGYSIMQNGGQFNDVGHYHMHIFPRYKNDGFGWTYSEKEYAVTRVLAEEIKSLF